jgi:hypothetical protein
MVYVDSNGNVGGKKSWSRAISDFVAGIINFIALFFSAITNPPQRLTSGSNYAQRHQGRAYRSDGGGGGRSSNIRGMKNLQGPTSAKMGGG